MEYKEFTAKNTEEALSQASTFFNLPLNQLEVEVVSSGSSGFLGFIGGKKAKVLARPSSGEDKDEVAEMMKEFSNDESFKPVRQEKPKAKKPQAAPQPSREAAPSPKEPKESGNMHESWASQEATPSEQPAPKAQSQPAEEQEVIQAAQDVLERLLKSLDENAAVSVEATGSGINLEIQGGESGILIGRRGQTLEALQYLTTRIVSHQEGRPVKISIDAGGYRRRRRDNMTDLAVRMAHKAKKTGKPVAVGPLAAQDRRIIHLALRNEQGISTTSRGRGEMKKVIINPRYHHH
jgi:spoIIIJ-associated protein